MKQLVVNVWCDVCAEQEIQEPGATTPPITVGAAKPRTLDLCDVHREDVDALVALLKDKGTPIDGAPVPGTPAKAKRGGKAKWVDSASNGQSNGQQRGPSAADIREWARNAGYEVTDRGRVPAELRQAYDEAH